MNRALRFVRRYARVPVAQAVSGVNESNRVAATMTRFWDQVHAHSDPQTGEWHIRLDNKPVKTPLGFPLVLPRAKKALAHLVAHEWANLPDLKIKTWSMPLTLLVARAVDLHHVHHGTAGVTPEMSVKVGRLEDIREMLLRYFDTDTCLIFATAREYEGRLRAQQLREYTRLIQETEEYFSEYAKKYHAGDAAGPVKIRYLDCETAGLRGNQQSEETRRVAMQWMRGLGVRDTIALEKAVLTSKSFLCGVALVRLHGTHGKFRVGGTEYYRGVEEVIELGNMETIFQTRQWGEVEDTHDVDKAEWARSLSSAALLCD